MEFRVLGPGDAAALSELFSEIDRTYFRPHPFSAVEALRIATHTGRDVYAVLEEGGRFVAYGMLRGWDEGYSVPAVGVAVRIGSHRQGLGRLMMTNLHTEAQARGAKRVRLRVHPDNLGAQRLYQSLGYTFEGVDRDELLMLCVLGGNVSPPAGIDDLGRGR